MSPIFRARCHPATALYPFYRPRWGSLRPPLARPPSPWQGACTGREHRYRQVRGQSQHGCSVRTSGHSTGTMLGPAPPHPPHAHLGKTPGFCKVVGLGQKSHGKSWSCQWLCSQTFPWGFLCDLETQRVAAEPPRPPPAPGFGSEVQPRAPSFALCQGSACKKKKKKLNPLPQASS